MGNRSAGWSLVVGAVGVAVVAIGGCSAAPPASGGPPVRISADRADVLADEPVGITVEGVPHGDEVTVWARRVDGADRPWLAHATFPADGDGRVHLAAAAPSTGTYEGVDGMGLFRSVALADGAAAQPPFPTAGGTPFTLSAVVDGRVVAQTEVRQRVVADAVTRREIRESGVVGVLLEPPGPGPHPAVVVLGGSDGGIPDHPVASMLASRGYAVLALGYFRAEGLPPTLERIPLEYFSGAIDWLRAQPGVADGRVGVAGASRGGELALLLGSTFPDRIGAVIASVPSAYVSGGLSGYGVSGATAWTHEGRDVPFAVPVPDASTAFARYFLPMLLGTPIPDTAGTWEEWRGLDPGIAAAATIPVERIAGPVLFVSGTDDRLWPSTPLAQLADDRLTEAGHLWPHEHLALPGAGHFVFSGTPYAGPFPTSPTPVFLGGGTPAANADGIEAAWPRILATLAAGLAPDDGTSTDGETP